MNQSTKQKIIAIVCVLALVIASNLTTGAILQNHFEKDLDKSVSKQVKNLSVQKEETSSQGEKGEAGSQGSQGEKGATGAQGQKGEKGATGTQGQKGEKGENGENGLQGPKGENGIDGMAMAIPFDSAKASTYLPGQIISYNSELFLVTQTPKSDTYPVSDENSYLNLNKINAEISIIKYDQNEMADNILAASSEAERANTRIDNIAG